MTGKELNTDTCLNCQEALKDQNYCPNCGQKNDGRRITFWQLVTESLSNFFAFDGRFSLTLRNLIVKPGQVPLEYQQGKRMRYMPPVRLYFMCSVVMLFLMNLSDESRDMAMINIDTSTEQGPAGKQPKSAKEEFLNLSADSSDTKETKLSLDSLPQPTTAGEDNVFEKIWEFRSFNLSHASMPDSLALKELNYEVNFWNSFLYHQSVKSNNMRQEEFNQFFYKNVFWILFLFVPVLGLWLKLFYWRIAFYYPEHLFFAFFNQSVLFLLFSLGFITQLGSNGFSIILLLYGGYLFWAMRVFYQQNFLVTLLKFLVLNGLVIISFVIFILLSLIVTYLIF